MEQYLRHLVNITGHRDHSLLDISVVVAIYNLVGAFQVRVLDVFPYRDEMFLRQKVWIENGEVVSEDNQGVDHSGVPMSTCPLLVACVEERRNCSEEITPDGTHRLWLPIRLDERLGACLEVCNTGPYSSENRMLILSIADVYHNAMSLLDYSERDSLTGLFNRKTFDEKFSKMAFSMALQESQSLQEDDERRQHAKVKAQFLAVVDIDHFKRVNDEFGHLYGDEVLILIANLLRASFRTHDPVFRFGGEEFVILLRSTTADNARAIFDRFREKVEKHEFPQVGRVTISLGFVSITMETPVVILGHADQALYYAKEHGRNQVSSYDELVATGFLKAEVSKDDVEFF
jgi:diguanylate cyclase (GGDEF)-like protein